MITSMIEELVRPQKSTGGMLLTEGRNRVGKEVKGEVRKVTQNASDTSHKKKKTAGKSER